MTSPTMWLGIAGFFIISIMVTKRVSAAIIVGIIFVTVISW